MSGEQMKWEHIIYEDGRVVTNVLERQDSAQCGQIRQITNGIGDELSDEQTGPECDEVFERTVG
jgi:hypothetical protein